MYGVILSISKLYIGLCVHIKLSSLLHILELVSAHTKSIAL